MLRLYDGKIYNIKKDSMTRGGLLLFYLDEGCERMLDSIKNRSIIIYGKGKLQQDFEFVFDFLHVEDYINPNDSIFEQIQQLKQKYSDMVVIVCDRNVEHAEHILKENGLERSEDFYVAEDLFIYLEPVFSFCKSTPIYIWGCGNIGQQACEVLEEVNDSFDLVKGFIDNKVKKGENVPFGKYMAYNPNDVLQTNEKIYIFVAVYDRYQEIKEELQHYGYREGEDFCQLDCFGDAFRMMKKTYAAYPDKNNRFLCVRGLEHVAIGLEGTIGVCCSDMIYFPSIGNLLKNDFKDIWNSNKAKIWRCSIKNETYSFCDHGKCPFLKEYEKDMEIDEHRIQELPDAFGTERRLDIDVEFDNTCNLYCSFCRDKILSRPDTEHSVILRNKILEEIFPYAKSIMVATNGEVFISKQYRKLMEMCCEVPKITLLSNGNCVDFGMVENIRKKCSVLNVSISVDAACEATYNKLRRGGNFNRLMNNLNKIGELRRKGVIDYFELNFVSQKENYREMEKFILLAEDLSADAVNFGQLMPKDVFSENEYDENSLIDKTGKIKNEYKQYFKRLKSEQVMIGIQCMEGENATYVNKGKELEVTDKSDKVIFWGTFGQKAKRIFDNFEGIFDNIEVFVDKKPKESSIEGIRVQQPSNYISESDQAIVVATQKYFEDIYNELIFKYNVKKERILSLHEWVCKLICERKIKLKPKNVRLETCTLCQLDCAWCYMRTSNYGATGRGYLSFERFKEFLDKNDFLQCVEISNSGEVFLNKDLALMLEYAYEKHIDITIGNGTNFNDVSNQMLELLVKTQVKFINISLDGASQEIYSIYRRKGNFDKVIENIKKLNSFKKKYNSEYPKLQWQYILMEHNLCDVEKAKHIAEELNMHISYTYDGIKDEFAISNAEELKKITGLDYLTKKEYNEANIDSVYGQDYCYQMIFSPQINFDGRLLGCCMVWDDDWGVNVFEEGLENSLNSEKYLNAVMLLLGAKKDLEEFPDNPCLKACISDMGIGRRIRRKNYMYI